MTDLTIIHRNPYNLHNPNPCPQPVTHLIIMHRNPYNLHNPNPCPQPVTAHSTVKQGSRYGPVVCPSKPSCGRLHNICAWQPSPQHFSWERQYTYRNHHNLLQRRFTVQTKIPFTSRYAMTDVQTTNFHLSSGQCPLNSHLKGTTVTATVHCLGGEADQTPHVLQTCSLICQARLLCPSKPSYGGLQKTHM